MIMIITTECNLIKTRASKRLAKNISICLCIWLYDFAGRVVTGGKVISLQVFVNGK